MQSARLKQAAHRFGGVSVLGDDRLQRSLLAERGSVFRANRIKIFLGFGFFVALAFDRPAEVCDLARKPAGTLDHGFKFQLQLTALSTESFGLRCRNRDFRA